MKVIINFCIDADLIECPDELTGKISEYRNQFLDWLGDEKNDHAYWHYVNGQKIGNCFRSDAFVEWLNTFILSSRAKKARVLEEKITDWDKHLITLYF